MYLVGISYLLCQGFSAIITPNMVAIEISFQNSLSKIKKCMNDTVAAPHFSLILLKGIHSFSPWILFGEHSIFTGLA